MGRRTSNVQRPNMGIVPRHIRAQQRADDLEKIANIILATAGNEDPTNLIVAGGHTLPGEQMTLRCTPITTHGVGSVIPGTDPLQTLIAKENKLERRGQRLIPRRRHPMVLP